MSEEQQPYEPVLFAEPPPPPRYPFWGYQDVLLFLLLALPSLFLGLLLIQGISSVSPNLKLPKHAIALVAQFVGYFFWFGALQVLLRVRYDAPFWRSLGWVRPREGTIRSFLGGPVLAVTVGVVGLLLRTPKIPNPFEQFLTGPGGALLLGFAIVVLGPIAEELAFRGFLLPLLVRDLGSVLGVLATSVPFALLHGSQYSWQWQNIVLIGLAGSVFGAARLWTGSTLASTVMHATYNLTLYSAYVSELIKTKQITW